MRSGGLRDGLRILLIATLALAPFPFGSVQPWAYWTIIGVALGGGFFSWAHARWARSQGTKVPHVPLVGLLFAFIGLVALQLVPLPPWLLARLSPGSYGYYDFITLGGVRSWHCISINPIGTARGLVFLVAMGFLYATVVRDFGESRWRNRLAGGIVVTGLALTVEALVQAASSEPTRIFGIYKPYWDWGVFGPYLNKNNFAGYIVMALPIAIAWAGEGWRELRRQWGRRRAGWIALGDPEGLIAIRRTSIVLVLLVGLIASRSRGGLAAFVVAAILAPLLIGRRRLASMAIVALAASGYLLAKMMELNLARGLQRGLGDARFAIWKDAFRMFADFPLLGSGFDTFGRIYMRYQAVWTSVWVGEAHNEYLQILLETGVVGACLVGVLLFRLLATGRAHGSVGVVQAGAFGGVLALCLHNVVEFNWQIPANAATFAALAGLAAQAPRRRSGRLDSSGGPRLESASLDREG